MVGTIVGAVEKSDVITGEKIVPGDQLIGLGSAGLHTNGFSLVRRIVFDKCGYDVATYLPELSATVGEALLACHKSYVKSVLELRKVCEIKGIAHITGGGLPANVLRILPDGCIADIRKGTWEIPLIFPFLQEKGNVEEIEMYRVFNMGIGMVIVLAPDAVDDALKSLDASGESTYCIGEVVAGQKRGARCRSLI